MEFKYGRIDRDAKNKKTVVMIKGGPTTDSWLDKMQPSEVKDCDGGCNLIVVEIPGAGHNRFGADIDFDREIGVEAAASLVRDIVRAEGLENYVLAGHSYGTTVATAAASMITEDPKAKKPKGVLLMGTVGRATRQLPGGHEVTRGPQDASDKAYAKLSAEEKTRFKRLVDHAKSRPAAEGALGKLTGALLGPLSVGQDTGLETVRKLLALTPEQVMTCLNSSRPKAPGGREPRVDEIEYMQKFYSTAGCELVAGDQPMDTSLFFGGTLVSSRPNSCYCSSSKRTGTYDAKNWKIKDVPLYYVSAPDDFNTPPYQQRYHEAQQRNSAAATHLFSEEGGHGVGYAGVVGGQCGGAVDAIFDSSPSRFQSAMGRCAQGEKDGHKKTESGRPTQGQQ